MSVLCLGEALVDLDLPPPGPRPRGRRRLRPALRRRDGERRGRGGAAAAPTSRWRAARRRRLGSLAARPARGGRGVDTWFALLPGGGPASRSTTSTTAGEPHYPIYGDAIGPSVAALGAAPGRGGRASDALFLGSNTLVRRARARGRRSRPRRGGRAREAGALRPQPSPGPLGNAQTALELSRACVEGAFLVKSNRAEARALTGDAATPRRRRGARCGSVPGTRWSTLGADGRAPARRAACHATAAAARPRWSLDRRRRRRVHGRPARPACAAGLGRRGARRGARGGGRGARRRALGGGARAVTSRAPATSPRAAWARPPPPASAGARPPARASTAARSSAPHGGRSTSSCSPSLSQSTNDRNRDVAFLRLRERFPTWEAVRDAPRRGGRGGDPARRHLRVKSARIQEILARLGERLDLDRAARRCRSREARAQLMRAARRGAQDRGLRAAVLLRHARRAGRHPRLARGHAAGPAPAGRAVRRAPRRRCSPSRRAGAELELHVNLLRHGRRTCHAAAAAVRRVPAAAGMCPSAP